MERGLKSLNLEASWSTIPVFGNDEIDNISLLHVISTNQHSIYTGFPNNLQAELWSYESNNHDQIVTNNLRT